MSNVDNMNLSLVSPDNNLGRYLDHIKKFPMLEAGEEYLLAKDWLEKQDTKAAHKLVTSHLRLVAKIAMGYRGYGLPIADLIAEGNGDNTGFVNIHSTAVIDMNTNELRAQTSDGISMAAERKIDINCMQKIGLNAANVKVVESADVASLIGAGSNTIIQTGDGIYKLLKSMR